MAKIEKYVKQVDYLWYHADITDEQLVEYKRYLNDEIEEPDWVHELDSSRISCLTPAFAAAVATCFPKSGPAARPK